MPSSALDNGRKHRPNHVEVTWNNKLLSIAHLVGYFHSCITMHGFMNVKLFFLKTLNIEQTELHERKTDGQIQTLIYAQTAYIERGGGLWFQQPSL
jgi:hypothetical protein